MNAAVPVETAVEDRMKIAWRAHIGGSDHYVVELVWVFARYMSENNLRERSGQFQGEGMGGHRSFPRSYRPERCSMKYLTLRLNAYGSLPAPCAEPGMINMSTSLFALINESNTTKAFMSGTLSSMPP